MIIKSKIEKVDKYCTAPKSSSLKTIIQMPIALTVTHNFFIERMKTNKLLNLGEAGVWLL